MNAQAAWNSLGGYVVGRMEGNQKGNNNSGGAMGRIPSRRALQRYSEYEERRYSADLDYLEKYSGIANQHADLEHARNQDAEDRNAARESEQSRLNSNLQKAQMSHAAELASGLQGARVESFDHGPDGVTLTFFPPASKGKKKKSQSSSGTANGKPPEGGGRPASPFEGKSFEELEAMDRSTMSHGEKIAHTKAKSNHPDNPNKAPR